MPFKELNHEIKNWYFVYLLILNQDILLREENSKNPQVPWRGIHGLWSLLYS